MDLMNLIPKMPVWCCLFFIVIVGTSARPSTDFASIVSLPLNTDHHFSDEYLLEYPPARSIVVKDSLLNRLRRGYYYIEKGEIIPINPLNLNRNIEAAARRQDNFGNAKIDNNTKPKKLFVPNLFG